MMDVIQEVGPHACASALDLSMGGYHCCLDGESSDMSTFMLLTVQTQKKDPNPQLRQGPCNVASCNEASATLHVKRKNCIEHVYVRNAWPHFGKMK